MVSPNREVSYQCDRCGSANIVALAILHQQGTRTLITGSGWRGSSQSYSAQAAAPPKPKSSLGPIVVYGFLLYVLLFWARACYAAMLNKKDPTLEYPMGCLLILAATCLVALILTCRNIVKYNRDVFPRLHWHWAHTYQCRRCGELICIPA
jgi:predicted RNA-binding Zn-ribbon protein involved in translation (DUF1610 family)